MDSDAAASSGGEEEEPPKRHFKFADLLAEVPNGDTAAAAQLVLTERGLTSMDSLEAFRSLRKLELRGNNLTSLGFLEMNHALCWLGLGKNRLRRLSHLQNLSSLAVLDISDNRISRLDGLGGLSGLKALIAARNRISQISGLAPKTHPVLETIVLSNNVITECRLSNFKSLRKLSVAHNQLHGFPELTGLPALAELRLNGNRVCSVAGNLSYLPALSILDVGNNLFSTPSELEPLRGLRKLKSLNLLGNSVASDLESPALKSLFDSLNSLEIVNNRRLAGESQKKRRQPGADKTPRADKASESQKKRGQLGANKAPKADKVAPAPAAKIAVHGRAFEGRRAVFDSEDEDEGPADTQARTESPKIKKKGKKKQALDGGASGKRAEGTAEAPETLKRKKKGKKKQGSEDSLTGKAKRTKRKVEGSGQLRPKASKAAESRGAETSSKHDDHAPSARTPKVKRKKRKVSTDV